MSETEPRIIKEEKVFIVSCKRNLPVSTYMKGEQANIDALFITFNDMNFNW